MDVVLGVAKRAAAARPDLKIIVSCSGVDPTPFLQYFRVGAPALPLPGPQFPVSLHSSPLAAGAEDASPVSLVRDHILPAVVQCLTQHPHGHALVYLPGPAEVAIAVQALRLASSGTGDSGSAPCPLPAGLVPVALVDGTMGVHEPVVGVQ